MTDVVSDVHIMFDVQLSLMSVRITKAVRNVLKIFICGGGGTKRVKIAQTLLHVQLANVLLTDELNSCQVIDRKETA